MLTGTEVKSLREGRASLVDGYAAVKDGEVWLHNVHIPEYTQGTWTNHEPRRARKLLLHRDQIRKLNAKTQETGLTHRAAGAVLQGRLRQGRDRRLRAARSPTTSDTRWPSGRPSGTRRVPWPGAAATTERGAR